MDAAELLLSARHRAGLTQAELAARAGTSQPVISAYEHGRRDPTVSTLRRLLRAAGTRLDLRAGGLVGPIEEAALPTDDRARGARLVDVLLLADAIPVRRSGPLRFPRIST